VGGPGEGAATARRPGGEAERTDERRPVHVVGGVAFAARVAQAPETAKRGRGPAEGGGQGKARSFGGAAKEPVRAGGRRHADGGRRSGAREKRPFAVGR